MHATPQTTPAAPAKLGQIAQRLQLETLVPPRSGERARYEPVNEMQSINSLGVQIALAGSVIAGASGVCGCLVCAATKNSNLATIKSRQPMFEEPWQKRQNKADKTIKQLPRLQ